MSILIKGMMKPENCVECPISTIYCDLWRERNEEDMYNGCHPDCPIVEIPPHGRLIDADALWMDIIHAMDYCEDILEFIEASPTIIDAEEEEDVTEKR